MYSKNQLLDSLRHETRVCKHLHSKLGSEHLGYQPAEGMRTTLELLRYLSYCGIAVTEALLEGGWEKYKARAAAAENLTTNEFSAAMDRQMAELEELIGGLSEEDLLTRQVDRPGGGPEPLGAALVNATLKFLTSYRMQLFLHAKASGLSELSTANNWAGQDKPAA